MARHSHPAMAGMQALGDRLKSLRAAAGISQMKLAAGMGFDPTHGYKYILRLEKGLVPNPTLRTIAAFLEACGADWSVIADVLPATSDEHAGPATRAVTSVEPQPAPAEPVPEIVIEHAPPVPPKRRDSRPLREQLRQRRIAEHEQRAQRYWRRVAEAEEQTLRLLRSHHIGPGLHRNYLIFVRSSCSIADANADRISAATPELKQLQNSAADTGLDSALLARITDICIEALRKPDATA
jgi:transcriptional regulator with XRE-family HTH domain